MVNLAYRESGNAGRTLGERRAFETIGKIFAKFNELIEEMVEKAMESR